MTSRRPERTARPQAGSLSLRGLFATRSDGGYVLNSPTPGGEQRRAEAQAPGPVSGTTRSMAQGDDEPAPFISDDEWLQQMQDAQPRTTYVPAFKENPDSVWTLDWYRITVSLNGDYSKTLVRAEDVSPDAKRFAEWTVMSDSERQQYGSHFKNYLVTETE